MISVCFSYLAPKCLTLGLPRLPRRRAFLVMAGHLPKADRAPMLPIERAKMAGSRPCHDEEGVATAAPANHQSV
jgi:hypothetical protein